MRVVDIFSVQIKGTKPYLMHAFRGEELRTKKVGAIPTVEQDCETSLYRNSSGRIYVPQIQIWASMRDAAKAFPYHGRKMCGDAVKSSVFIEPEELVLEPQTYEPFRTGVVISRARIYKARPMFKDWSLKFKIKNADERLTEQLLKDILTEAGDYRGIGDWRPRYGTFEIESWSREKFLHITVPKKEVVHVIA